MPPCGFDTLYIDTTSAITAGINILSLESDSVNNDEISLRDGFIDAINTKGQYNFSIETLGWFNIDAYMEPLEGTQKVDLFVKTDFPDNSALDVHVFFPARKLLTVGIYEKDGLFHFEK
jgi:hypothetical protein